MKILDAHHHLWDPVSNYHPWLRDEPMIPFRYGDYSAIRVPYLPAHYRHDAAAFELAGSVYVETEWDPTDALGETRWIHAIADAHGLPNAVVAQAWLDREDAAELLAAQAAWPLVRSVRHKPTSAANAANARRGAQGSMDDPRWRDGFRELARNGLAFDLQTPWWHLDAALELARDFPATRIILNHTGLPSDRSEDGLQQWRTAMSQLAAAPNVMVKISGLGQPGMPWSAIANGPIVLDTIAMFGVERCMFASNFPVDSLCVTFTDLYRGFSEITAAFSAAERDALFHGNAVRCYSLDETSRESLQRAARHRTCG